MAIIKPFEGVRPPKNLVDKVSARPYDVLSSEEAREEAAEKFAKDSKSKIGKIRSAVQGVFSIDDNEDEKAPHMKKVRVVTSVVFSLE